MHTSFRYLKNLPSPYLEDTFLLQLGEYAKELVDAINRALKGRRSGTDRPERIGWRICKRTFQRYRLRCQLLELLADGMARRELDRTYALMVMRAAATVLELLSQPVNPFVREGLERGFEWLVRMDETFPERILVFHALEWEPLSPRDHVGWLLLTKKRFPILSWNFHPLVPDLCKRLAESKRKNPQPTDLAK